MSPECHETLSAKTLDGHGYTDCGHGQAFEISDHGSHAHDAEHILLEIVRDTILPHFLQVLCQPLLIRDAIRREAFQNLISLVKPLELLFRESCEECLA